MESQDIPEVQDSIHSRLPDIFFLWPSLIKFSNYVVLKVDKRAHHNALERKRRDHIKDSFSGLRDSVPSLQSEKV